MSSNDSLPTQQDFDPWEGNLDAQCAWKNFGGLSLEEAIVKFRLNPLNYQEDFMFMGGRAFAYYFPVIESHLKSVPHTNPDDDSQAWVLACGVRLQFDGDRLAHVKHLETRVIDLARFVHENIQWFGSDEVERRRVADAWSDLIRHVQAACAG